jgi:hypothetical protein
MLIFLDRCCGVLREQFGFFWLHASLSGDGVELPLCTEKQLKLDVLVATNRRAIVATIEAVWSVFFCPDKKFSNCPDN